MTVDLSAASAAGGTPILFVDDDEDAAATYRVLLSMAGYAVSAVHSVREALDLLDERPDISLVVSDVRMPEVDGLDLVRVLRHRFPNLPCILLTGAVLTGEDVIPHEALIVTKPVPIEELTRAISDRLQASSAKTANDATPRRGKRSP